MTPSKWAYYLQSIPTLWIQILDRRRMLQLLAGRPSGPQTVRLRSGCRFSVRNFMDLWIVKETCLDREYERDLPPCGEKWAIMDIGAGLGDFSVCAAWDHPHRRIAAFEPFEESYRLLQENLRLNGIGNVRAFPFAVGAVAGPMTLQTATGVAVQHSTAAPGRPGLSGLSVEGITLSDALGKSGFDRCDLLKADCEGGEYDIFFGATPDVLRRIDRIVMEYHDGCTPHSHGELAAYLETHDFSVRLRANPVHRHLGFLTAVRRP
jgi:FkbM family methyltransferase